MIRSLLAALILAVLIAVTIVADAHARKGDPITKTNIVVPHKRAVVRSHFKPWARPNYRQVLTIIGVESRKWGAPAWHLGSRIRCESSFEWWQWTGQFGGLGQFSADAFRMGWSTIKTRRVMLHSTYDRKRRAVVYVHHRSGRVVRRLGRRLVGQHVNWYRVGMIPRHPSMLHGWAQVRIMAQAMVGHSAVPDSAWQCR